MGIMLQYKKVQAGLYLGADQINNQSKNNWESNGKVWLAFGMGFQIFQFDIAGEKAEKQNK